MTTIQLELPRRLRGKWSIDWLVDDHAQVDEGDLIATIQDEKERFFVMSPASGELHIGVNPAEPISSVIAALATLIVDTVDYERLGKTMDNAKKVYMEKLKVIVKDAVKDDFKSIKEEFDEVKQDFEKVNKRLDETDRKLGSLESDVKAIKLHFGIK